MNRRNSSPASVLELRRGRLLILAAGFCWSLAGASVKLAKPLDGWQIAGFRSLFAFFMLAALVRFWRARPFWPSLKVGILACFYAGMLTLFILANTLTTAANAIFLQDTAPLWVMLLAPWLLKEPFRARDLLVFFFCAVGMALFFLDDLSLDESRGNLLALLSGVGFAAVFLGLRWGRRRDPPGSPAAEANSPQARDRDVPASVPAVTVLPEPIASLPSDSEVIIVWGNLLCFLVCIPWMGPLPPFETALGPLAIVAFMGVFQLGLGYYLLVRGFSRVPAVEASLLALSEPVLNPLWAFLFAHERPGKWALVGGAIMITTLALNALRGTTRAEVEAKASS